MLAGHRYKADSGRSYEIVDSISEDCGEARIFRAISLDENSKPFRALKKYRVAKLTSKKASARFHQESQILRCLNNVKNIDIDLGVVKLFDSSEENLFLTLEYVEGKDFETVLDKRGYGNFSLLETVSMTERLSKTLSEILSLENITHRDIKPANLLVDSAAASNLEWGGELSLREISRPGAIKLCDFTLSLRNGESKVHDLTRMGFFVGSTRFCPPEVLWGERGSSPSDVWSLAILAYDMISEGGAYTGLDHNSQIFTRNFNHSPPKIKNDRENNFFGFDELLYKMRSHEDTERPTMAEVNTACQTLREILKERKQENTLPPMMPETFFGIMP